MIFRQLFHQESGTYTYLLARRRGGEAILIDPVLEDTDKLLKWIHELDVRLIQAFDTHTHADHITALGALRDRTGCDTVIGRESYAECATIRVQDGQILDIDGLKLQAIYTPGHTDDSYSYFTDGRVFTGDTLLIRGSGRTDFQNGNALAQYDSIFNKLLVLPDSTLMYPGHDYRGFTMSTIGEERRYNPRLQVRNAEEYARLMSQLVLPNPRLMDTAVPANRACGRAA
ncbi:MAG: MBL fold metallo-hydrolase [Myxococcales bacterium]|nr:MBL fold metallo-hydrolase [Myxococcales bacterium]